MFVYYVEDTQSVVEKTSGVVAQTYKEENIIIQKQNSIKNTFWFWLILFVYCVIIVFSHAQTNECIGWLLRTVPQIVHCCGNP